MLREIDLPHVGALCKHIRHSRGITRHEIAEKCNRVDSTIGRLETDGRASWTTFQCYVKALQKPKNPTPNKLTTHQGNLLLEQYFNNKNKHGFEKDLAAISFEDITPQQCPPRLGELVDILRQEERPALIMDSLWFVHAINGALPLLFGMNSKSEYLYNWEAWHAIATKFHIDNIVGRAHYNPDEYLPPSLVQFIMDKRTFPFLFTIQMRMLIFKLHELSNKYGYKFYKWWLGIISFNLEYELKYLTRTILYEGRRIQTEVLQRMNVEVEISPGYDVLYTLAVWDPIGSDSKKAFNKISALPESREILFAADYDTNKNFHVNSWPEVKDVISWLPQY